MRSRESRPEQGRSPVCEELGTSVELSVDALQRLLGRRSSPTSRRGFADPVVTSVSRSQGHTDQPVRPLSTGPATVDQDSPIPLLGVPTGMPVPPDENRTASDSPLPSNDADGLSVALPGEYLYLFWP